MCDRIVVLSEGKIVANDTPVTLLKNSSGGQLKLRIEGKEEWLLPFLSQIPGIRQVRSLGIKENGSVDFLIDTEGDIDVRREIFRRLASRKCPLLYMAPLETNLEQVFLHLTDED
ncbi:MAG: hypothetical protein LUH07_04815 [Lachnospiraceae bacterium]|nr:hypothetical protein [Lachnospiraceae bacterium]